MIEKLLRHGANCGDFSNMIGGMRLASELIRPSVVGFLASHASGSIRNGAGGGNLGGRGSSWIGKKLKELGNAGALTICWLWRYGDRTER